MKNILYILTLITVILSCSKKESTQNPTFDSYGNETKDCSVRDAKGHGPYEKLGRFSSRACKTIISKKCNEKKYKQVHRHKGHFARGKFGDKIMIGTCP